MTKRIFPAILLLATLLTACSKPEPTGNTAEYRQTMERLDIEQSARRYWAIERPSEEITGVSLQKFSDSIYLVGTTFRTDETHAANIVVRKFENNGEVTWKAEFLNSKWRSILRLDPE